MLEVSELETGYGETRVIHGLSLNAVPGRMLAILGRNGAGKTTTLKAIMGLLPAAGGDIRFQGKSLVGTAPYDIAKHGIAYVPETRDIFPSLTVRENLMLAARMAPRDATWTLERVFEFFPRLGERLNNGGNQLSGGEQQMLAIGRALLMNPKLLILDEPTEGLAPIIVRQIHDKLAALKEDGMTMILVEQNFGFATSLADEVVIVGRGRSVWEGLSADIRADTDTQHKWLGV
ncbi:ABC transporter ATP-binding protein [Amorphus orientalis]|uniref:Branched-chain amino acid transport system ATP-binding protein n=1 Tax=Amorphus orientalis TaxID=649198 RepID=A0AAE3VQS2_9HYPH|nr:ABC transporter ATP-binding protein [Amorphus orientalis]MDQ0316475.1 branched-chain amino acid transport system ATP-binding protein [Amorphus orientalis]